MMTPIITNPGRASIVAALSALALFSCAPVRQIRPLHKGESSVHAGLGGPITRVGEFYVPLPLLSLNYNYGLLEKADIEAGFHATQALFGIMHINAGTNWRPWTPDHFLPGLIVSPAVHFMTDFRPGSARVYPVLDLNACWKLLNRHYAYCGIENWFELTAKRGDGLDQEHHWLIAPHIGVSLGVKKWDVIIEGVLYTPNLHNTGRGAENIGAGEYGIFGVFFGAGYRFGGGAR
ncbi:MAG: hypothetical protein GF350_17210 [Chitinivibrionales bacterium]|nr:hypothetical protein [Chitinivibrionales bacterium]